MRIEKLIYLVLLFPTIVYGFDLGGMQNPGSFIVDPETGNYFVSNVNGEPAAKDNKGFIAKLDPAGKLINLNFITGGEDQVELHAPKGMSIFGDELYVADIDVVQRFDKNTGHPRGTIDLKFIGAAFLSGLTVDTRGNIYVSDATNNVIYQIDPKNSFQVTVLSKGVALGNPHNMAYDTTFKRLVVASWSGGRILSVNMSGKILILVNRQFKNLDGVDFDRNGNLLVSSFTEGKIYRIKNFSAVEVVKENILTPAGISFDRKNNQILIPSYDGNQVFTHPLN